MSALVFKEARQLSFQPATEQQSPFVLQLGRLPKPLTPKPYSFLASAFSGPGFSGSDAPSAAPLAGPAPERPKGRQLQRTTMFRV